MNDSESEGSRDNAEGAAVPKREEGIYTISGILVGNVDLMEAIQKGRVSIGTETPPDNLKGYHLLRWILRAESAFNPMTVFESYISLIGMFWGFFLLLPVQTFDGTGRLWEPVRTLWNSLRGHWWYDYGAEMSVGFLMLFIHTLHLFALIRRKNGDNLRSVTICCLLVGWFSLLVIFFVADSTVQNFFTLSVTVFFLTISLRACFRNSGMR